eukprot:Em0007g396a
MDNSSEKTSSSHAVIAATNSVSVLVCLLAAILVLVLKLHKKLVYRLALYQVLSSLLLATVTALQGIFINYNESRNVYARVCTAVAWLVVYSQWMKLLFTMWVTFHLFCFAVLHKNLKKLEVLYVVTSLLVPAVIAAVPLITRTYGLSPDGAICNIYANSSVAFIERLALWDGPAMMILLAASTAMLIMMIKLASKVCCRLNSYEPITNGDQFAKALKHLLPLAAFPLLFFIFFIPVLMFHIYVAANSKTSEGVLISAVVFYSLWSMASGLTLVIHVTVVKCLEKKKKHSTLIKNRHRAVQMSARL